MTVYKYEINSVGTRTDDAKIAKTNLCGDLYYTHTSETNMCDLLLQNPETNLCGLYFEYR